MKLFYIGYYSDIEKNRKSAPAADTKMNYIIDSLKSISNKIELISFCYVDDRSRLWKKYAGYVKKENGISIKYFTTYSSKFRIMRFIGRVLTWFEQKKYILDHCTSKDSTIIIYHSLLFFKLYKLLNKCKKEYILEVEEIYSDVMNNNRLRRKEVNQIIKGSKYIFPTSLLNDELNVNNQPYVIVHGTYKEEKMYKKISFGDNKVHCVYAGTFDSRKGGATAAISAAQYLPNNYHIHIIGFGLPQEIHEIKKEVNDINMKNGASVSYDGLLSGEEYLRFIQSCNIGLSTQNPHAAFNGTSFPSKILSYMANGLRVVSIKIPAIESSEISDYIYYYNKQDPKEIANAIMNINLDDKYDSRLIIKKLNKDFVKKLIELLKVE